MKVIVEKLLFNLIFYLKISSEQITTFKNLYEEVKDFDNK